MEDSDLQGTAIITWIEEIGEDGFDTIYQSSYLILHGDVNNWTGHLLDSDINSIFR